MSAVRNVRSREEPSTAPGRPRLAEPEPRSAVEARETITAASLPEEILGRGKKSEPEADMGPGFCLEDHLDEVAKRHIQEAGERASGNMSRMAELLGISYRSLRYLLEKYKIKSFGRTNGKNGGSSAQDHAEK